MIRNLSVSVCACLSLGLGASVWAGEMDSNSVQSYQALPTGPFSTTYLSSTGGRVEVWQTGPNTSYVRTTDRTGQQTSSAVVYGAPSYVPREMPLAAPPPVGNLFADPLRDPLGLVAP